MTKLEVLEIFYYADRTLTPDSVGSGFADIVAAPPFTAICFDCRGRAYVNARELERAWRIG